ncbi:HoxN/HupN/NixA family nickel/cobalt transporter [Microlunatus endophyticus]|nr:hypothetical protein [Microlunatus endophyticus]
MTALVAAGAHIVGNLVNDDSTAHQTLGLIGTLSSGMFPYVIGFLNLLALIGIVRVFQGLRHGRVRRRRTGRALTESWLRRPDPRRSDQGDPAPEVAKVEDRWQSTGSAPTE